MLVVQERKTERKSVFGINKTTLLAFSAAGAVELWRNKHPELRRSHGLFLNICD